jgi:hypothetical protein
MSDDPVWMPYHVDSLLIGSCELPAPGGELELALVSQMAKEFPDSCLLGCHWFNPRGLAMNSRTTSTYSAVFSILSVMPHRSGSVPQHMLYRANHANEPPGTCQNDMPSQRRNGGRYRSEKVIVMQRLMHPVLKASRIPIGTPLASIEPKPFCGCQSWSRYTVVTLKSSPTTGGIRCGKTVGL